MNSSNPLQGERRPGSVGPALPGVELRVVGTDGQQLPAGEVGELQIRGPNVFSRYWELPDKTAEAFTDDGFFRSGDQARIADDGYVAIVGRASDMIISGGLNVYPKEIEQVLDALPQILESAVIGLPHPDFGEGVVAVVVAAEASLEEAAIRQALRQQLAGYKLPQRILAVDSLPRNSMGKLQKSLLRERFRGLLN
jgi:malonyl-CoA/methylmalonyl-CoA synthetase